MVLSGSFLASRPSRWPGRALLLVNPPHTGNKGENFFLEVIGCQNDGIAVHKCYTAGKSPGAQRADVSIKVMVRNGFQRDPQRVGRYLPENGLAALPDVHGPIQKVQRSIRFETNLRLAGVASPFKPLEAPSRVKFQFLFSSRLLPPFRTHSLQVLGKLDPRQLSGPLHHFDGGAGLHLNLGCTQVAVSPGVAHAELPLVHADHLRQPIHLKLHRRRSV